MKETILALFDFDGTLFDSPLPEIGKEKWSLYYNKPYPYLGWWSKKESLDINVFDFKVKEEVIIDYHKINKLYKNVDNYVFISRLYNLKNNIQNILDKNNIGFKDILCFEENLTKGERIIKLYEKYKQNNIIVKDIYVWEDDQKHIKNISIQLTY